MNLKELIHDPHSPWAKRKAYKEAQAAAEAEQKENEVVAEETVDTGAEEKIVAVVTEIDETVVVDGDGEVVADEVEVTQTVVRDEEN